jgi:hypothetical protein
VRACVRACVVSCDDRASPGFEFLVCFVAALP